MIKTFAERCAEPIVRNIARYQVVPRYIEGKVTDKPGRYRADIESFLHHLEFLWRTDPYEKESVSTVENLGVGDNKSEAYCSEIVGKLKEDHYVNVNYKIEQSGSIFRMLKK